MSFEQKNYEIAYLLFPTIAEEDVLAYSGRLSALIEENGGMIKYAERPQKRKLAFPVKKERNAYFGWTNFAASADAVKDIEKKTKELEGFLRHLIVEKTMEKPNLRQMPFAVSKHDLSLGQRTENRAEEQPKDEKLDLEELDKKLEEILGK